MSTISQLIEKGYRVYDVDIHVNRTLKDYFRNSLGLLIDYNEKLKVITIKDAQNKDFL